MFDEAEDDGARTAGETSPGEFDDIIVAGFLVGQCTIFADELGRTKRVEVDFRCPGPETCRHSLFLALVDALEAR